MFFTPHGIQFPSSLSEKLAPLATAKNAASLGKLWEKLAKRKGVIQEGERHYSFDANEAAAYASYYLPVNLLKPALVLEEAHLLGFDILRAEGNRWLDIGTGPGTSFWGIQWWCEKRQKKLSFSGVDQSPLFVSLASQMARNAFSIQPNFSKELGTDPVALAKKFTPTHISFMNSLTEIFPDLSARIEAIKKLLAHLEAAARDGKPRYLLIIEPGSKENSRDLSTLKDALQAKVLLPCLSNRKCGALAKPQDWCHEEVECEFPAWLNELGASAKMRKESLLFSYLLLEVGGKTAQRNDLRVVSQRLERKGQVECWLCSSEGKIFARAQRSKAGPEAEILFQANRGDLWQETQLGEKGDLEKAELGVKEWETIFSEKK